MRLRSLLQICNRFSQFKPLSTIIEEAQLASDPNKAVQYFSKNPSLVNFHTALVSVYKRMQQSPNESTQLPSLIHYLDRFSKENSRHLYEVFLCKHPRSMNPILKQLYFHQLSKYVKAYKPNEIEFSVYYFIVEICSSFLFGDRILSHDYEGEEEPEFIKNAVQDFVNYYCEMLHLFDLQSKLSVARICKSLRLYNIEFLEHLKILVQTEHQHMTLAEVLVVMTYLEDARVLPYEFFYANKDKWFGLINKYGGNLQRRSQGPLLRLFEILAKENMVYTGRLIQSIIKLIKQNINQFDVVSLVRVIYYYSKVRFQDQQLVETIIAMLQKDIINIKIRSLKYMIMALGNLKYNELGFIRKLAKNEHFFQSLALASSEISVHKDYYAELVNVIKNP